jgi:hypothetical protein
MRAVAEKKKQENFSAKNEYEIIIGANAPNYKLCGIKSVLSGGQA